MSSASIDKSVSDELFLRINEIVQQVGAQANVKIELRRDLNPIPQNYLTSDGYPAFSQEEDGYVHLEIVRDMRILKLVCARIEIFVPKIEEGATSVDLFSYTGRRKASSLPETSLYRTLVNMGEQGAYFKPIKRRLRDMLARPRIG